MAAAPGVGCETFDAFLCDSHHECGADGICEMDRMCSFPDPACPSGRRYGEHSGEQVDRCTSAGEPAGEDPEAPGRPAADDDDPEPSTMGGGDATGGTTDGEGPVSATSSPLGEGSSGMATTSLGEGSTTWADAETLGMEPDECEVLYGLAEDFWLCEQTSETCEFYAQTGGNCGDLCQSFGGECITAFHDHGNTCRRANPIDCTSPQSNQICVCTR